MIIPLPGLNVATVLSTVLLALPGMIFVGRNPEFFMWLNSSKSLLILYAFGSCLKRVSHSKVTKISFLFINFTVVFYSLVFNPSRIYFHTWCEQGICYGLNCVPPQFIHWNPNPPMWLYVEIGPLWRFLKLSEVRWWGPDTIGLLSF